MNASVNSTGETFADVPVWLRGIHGTVLSLLLLASVVGNLLVLLLVLFNKSLRHRSVLCSLGLVVADMLIAVAWCVQSLAHIGLDYCPFGSAGCTIFGVLTSIGIYARWCIVALVTVERFLSIVFPFCYMKWSKALLIVLSITCWLMPVCSTAIPWAAGLGSYQFRLQYSACIITCHSDVVCFRFYLSLYGLYVGVGGVLPMLLYFSMCMMGQRKLYKMKNIELGTIKRDADVEAPSSENGPESCSDGANGDTAHAEDESSSRSSFRGIRSLDKKIFKTFFMIFVNVFLTQMPIYITSALKSNVDIFDQIPVVVHFIFTYIYLLGPVLDPLLIMRNRDFGDTFKKLWRRRKANAQAANMTQVLMDFVKLSSLIDVTLEGNNRTRPRRNSCPAVTLRKVVPLEQPIVKASSFDGCVSWDKERNPPLNILSASQVLTRSERGREEDKRREEAQKFRKLEEVRELAEDGLREIAHNGP